MAPELSRRKNVAPFAIRTSLSTSSPPVNRPSPVTSNLYMGAVVPIPTFLDESTVNAFPPTARSEEKRFVDEAVVEKKLVVVALVVVELPETRSELLNSNWSAEEFQVRRAFGDTEPLSNDR